MDSMRLGSRAAIMLATFAAVSIAQAALPELPPAQVLKPSVEDLQPDPEQPPAEAQFGVDVAIQDGGVAAVGLPGANDGAGRVAIFSRDASGTWIRRATLTAQDSTAGARFGKEVSLSGRHVLVAATNAIYVFEGAGAIWQERQRLALSATVSDVALAGRLVIVGNGVYGENGAQVFRLGRDGRLHAVAQLLPSDVQAADRFGASVAISGSTVAITAPDYNRAEGAAYVFTCNEFGCVQRQKLLANDGAHGRFGESVAVLGNTLVVGAPAADPVDGNPEEPTGENNFNAQGAAYVFVRSAGTWVETQKLRVTPEEYDWYYNLGLSVALSADSIVIGAPYGLTRVVPGKIFIYQRMGTMYVATHVNTGAEGLGHSVAISGSTVLSGAPLEYWDQGEADLYTIP
jgi:hypothetical protein